MNLVLLTEGTGQGVHGRKTNVSRIYDLLVENGNQRLNLEAGPGTRPFRHLGGTAGIRGEDYIELPSNVKFARHAVARDEQRRFFGYLPLREGLEDVRRETEDERRVEELVFPGSHSDVGGLYSDNHAIADVTLDWILKPALDRGLKISPPSPLSPPPPPYLIHDSLAEPTNGWGLLDPVKRGSPDKVNATIGRLNAPSS